MKTNINKTNEPLFCGGCVPSRRAFLANCAKCIGAAGVFSGFVVPTLLTANSCTPKRTMKIRVVFALHAPVQKQPDWPNIGFDFNPHMENIMNALTAGCPGIEFVQSMVDGAGNTEKLIASDQTEGNIDGYLLVQMNCWNQAIQQLVNTGKPVLYADFHYGGSGGFLVYTAGQLRAKAPNFAQMASGNLAHLVAAANCFPLAMNGDSKAFANGVAKIRKDIVAGVNTDMRCIDDKFDILSTDELLKELKTKKILEYENGMIDIRQQAKESLGIEILRRPFAELNDLWEKADKEQAMEIVKRWKSNAVAIMDVPDKTLEESARMYLAMKQCLQKHDACAITINCLGGFYGGHINAYPCLGFYELLNEGLIGACECDTLSTLTMVVMTTLTKGRPGYISDPVMDVATKQIIYAHCVASDKPFGPQTASNPFTIMTHSEDRQGASLRSTLPLGYMTTTLEIHPARKEILFHQAKAVENNTDDRACRTKIAAVPVGDFEKLFGEWDQWGWHRVTYYGDLKEPVFALANALGWKVLEEA
jgi:hypothetical protein